MRAFRLLAVRRLRLAPARAVTTVLAVAAGVSLAVSIAILLGSIDASIDRFGRELAGPAPLRITGATLQGGLPMEATVRAEAVDGVAAVIPMVQVASRTQTGPDAELVPTLVLGVDCRVEALTGSFGCTEERLRAVDGVLAIGPEQEVVEASVLRTDEGRLSLAGAPVVDGLRAGGGRSVLLPLQVAQTAFTRPGQVDVAYVLLDEGADVAIVHAALEEAVGPELPVLRAADPPAGASQVLGSALPIYSLLGLFALGIGSVLVSNIASMALESRRRELAVLGALGGTRRTIGGVAIAEMGLLGALGGFVGAFGGMVVANPIVASLSTFTEEVAGIDITTQVSVGNVVTGVVLGALLGAGSTLLPVRRATRMDVAAELSGRDSADTARPVRLGRRLVLSSIAIGVGATACYLAPIDGGLEPWQAALSQPGFLLIVVGTLVWGTAAAPLLLRAARRWSDRTGSAALRIGLAAAARDHRRTAVLAVTVAAAVATAFVTEASSAGADAGIHQSFRDLGAQVDVRAAPPNTGVGASLTAAQLDELRDVPGVSAVDLGYFVVTGTASDLIVVQAVTDNPMTVEVIDGVADPERLAAGEVMIGAGLARLQRIRAGDDVELPTPTGRVRLPVQGVWEDGNNVGVNLTMSPERLQEVFGRRPPGFVAARPADGVSEAQLAARIREAGIDPELETRTSDALADDIAEEVDASFASFRIMQQALLAVLFVAVLTSLLLAGIQRRRELGLLSAVGADPPGLARCLLVEAGLVGVAGVAVAAFVGPTSAWAMNRILPFVVGFVNPLVLEWSALLTAGVTSVVISVLGALWPARRAARVEVLEALRYE